MVRFVLRRLTFILPVFVLIVFFAHLGMGMVQNSDVPNPDYNVVSHGQRAWGKTLDYLSAAMQGDLGTVQMPYGPAPVKDLLVTAYINSMGLLLISLFLASVAGLYLGGASALTKRKGLVLALMTLTIIGISVPAFFAGLLLQQGALRFADTFNRRLVSMAGFGWDFRHMALPVLVLAARPLAYLTRGANISLEHVMNEDYIRTAYAKGLNKRQAVIVHGMRNMAIPMLTAIGVSLRFSMGALPIVEWFFNWPGMGKLLIEAIDARQTELVVTLAAVLGLTYLLINLLLDVLYRLVDPRMRED